MVLAEQVAAQTTPRIMTVCIGSFGRMVGRQIKRTVKNAPCIVPDLYGDLQLDSPEIKSRIVRSDVIFLVLDVRDSLSLTSAKRLIEEVIPGETLKAILTWDLAEDQAEEPHARLLKDYALPCACLVASPLSLGPSHEDLLDKFGIEMIATWLICQFVEKVLRRINNSKNLDIEFENLKFSLCQGGFVS
ncbi:hypothetical protein [Geoalkalibacter halelectricus]|uniref:Uncharacterized protein n=1 Tax=Geoalkalibacter halelectricus TaxID=2847045 RepID=A0ABY5ZM78_9BACT|nr:hypothetical protein [Geoalkalibacter halelectricus]MDO3377111.1 hypothetical protein [Geoalkalibacter halelectricus]UWZ79733.1 hypothetical protein L9S41_18940 [Geoalkalibacter halelectricus]